MARTPQPRATTPCEVRVLAEGRSQRLPDELATEEPLEIRLRTGSGRRTVAVTMRTPGADRDLALGFLFAEGVIRRWEDVATTRGPGEAGPDGGSVVEVELAPGLDPDLAPLERHFFTSSACGVCGRAGLEALTARHPPIAGGGPRIAAGRLARLPTALREAQGLFRATGGLHAAARFRPDGRLLAAAEDVGRHNAVDKLVGAALKAGEVPLVDQVVLVSGRASFEIVQKCLVARIPVLAAVSAPSSLAVSLARRCGMTLVGFVRQGRLNVYAGDERIRDGEGG